MVVNLPPFIVSYNKIIYSIKTDYINKKSLFFFGTGGEF